MKKQEKNNKSEPHKANFFERFALKATRATGSSVAFLCAVLVVVIWLFTGSLFLNKQNWLLLINTITTIITFLMVFLIQKAQNKDSLAIQLKLNELLAAHDSASNQLVNAEHLTESELRVIQKYYNKLSEYAKQEENKQQSHSIDELAELTDIGAKKEEKE
jgi:low affinity Fe/Cu permease